MITAQLCNTILLRIAQEALTSSDVDITVTSGNRDVPQTATVQWRNRSALVDHETITLIVSDLCTAHMSSAAAARAQNIARQAAESGQFPTDPRSALDLVNAVLGTLMHRVIHGGAGRQ